MAKTTAPTDPAVLSLKVTLRNIRPPIWRRILMSSGMTLGDLNLAIQATIGWGSSHLHAFEIGDRQFGDRSVMDDVENEDRRTLGDLMKSGMRRFRYTYDFGDNWQHDILIEKTPAASSGKNRGKILPACIAGKRNGPPEDCGGPWGYAELLGILSDPAHPLHDERLEWIGEEFDPEAFAVSAADAALAAVFGRRK
jgi:hypothetical protein